MSSAMQRYDWREVVDLNPQGYLEIQDSKTNTVIHGPVERVFIDDGDFVHIELKWCAQMGLPGTPTFGRWKYKPDLKDVTFPNLIAPFELQETPQKGKRICFSCVNLLYLERVEGLNPAQVEGLPEFNPSFAG